MIVPISPEQYQQILIRAEGMWADQKWQGGFAAIPGDRYYPQRIGCLGEMAFSIYSGLRFEYEYVFEGTSHDFLLNGHKVEVKTAGRQYKDPIAFVRAQTGSGAEIPLNSFYYVFATVLEDNRLEGYAIIELNGWLTRDELAKRKIVSARKGNHMNREVPYRELHNIQTLIKEGAACESYSAF